MSRVDRIHQKIMRGRGKEAKVLGLPHDAYRVKAGSKTSIFDASCKIFTNYQMFTKSLSRNAKGHDVGSIPFGLLLEVVGDMTPFVPGDVFLNADPFAGQRTQSSWAPEDIDGFVLLSNKPMNKAAGVRVNKYCYIKRQSQDVDENGNISATEDNARPLVLSNGVWSWGGLSDAPTVLCVGLYTKSTYGKDAFNKQPAMIKNVLIEAAMPKLQGVDLREGDRLFVQSGFDENNQPVYINHVLIAVQNQDTNGVCVCMQLEREG